MAEATALRIVHIQGFITDGTAPNDAVVDPDVVVEHSECAKNLTAHAEAADIAACDETPSRRKLMTKP